MKTRRTLLSRCGLWVAALTLPVMLWAQTPTGSISGVVHDASGAVVPNAAITMTNRDTGLVRNLLSETDGAYALAALPPGVYQIKIAVPGFRTLIREATVETGSVTTVDLRLEVGQPDEVINVEAASAQVEYSSNAIAGVITREKIQDLPLNGRSFLNLAFLEPGVSVSPGTTSQYNSLFSVSIMGGDSSKTAITVDGGNIRNPIEGNTGMNLSQEVVQEFQISSVNFDLSTGITSVGSVNVVTRSGGNDFHGSGYFFFRDHNMSAYPGLQRNALSPDPFFARRNPGAWIGGPVKKNKLFFFFNYENTNQTQVVTFVPNVASASSLAGNYFSPYQGKNLSVRFDYNITQKHHLFLRYSHDGNSGLGPAGSQQLPSHWLQNTNWSDQSLMGLTSTLKPTVVNDFRFSYQYWQNRNLFPSASQCVGCIGLGFPEVSVTGTNVTVGDTSNATQGRDLRKFDFTDSLSWQKGSHSIHFGGEIEHAPGTGFWGYCDPACTVVAPPELVRANVPASLIGALFPTLPTQIRSNADLLNLPFLGGVVGIGDPSQPPPYNVDQAKANDRYRVYATDSWRVKPNFTLNYGLAWSFESTLVNRDLSKPAFLAPLYGSDLSPTNNNYHDFEPALGFAWTVDKAQKTVIRGGSGIYYDTESLYRRLQERSFIGPVGNGRIQFPTTGFTNIFPGIVNISLGGVPVPVGAPLPSGQLINLTLGQYLQIQQQQAPIIAAQLAPTNLNNLSVTNIDINKAGAQLYPKNFPVQHGIHFNLGVQREISKDLVLNVDFVRRVYLNTNLGEIDYNRYNRYINGVRTPVIPVCAAAVKNTPGVECSNGSITFWTPGGRAVYNAMLVKLNKRFSRRFQLTASYALQDQHGYNGIVDLDHWNASWGPQNARNILNVSGVVDLPWGIQFGMISSSSTKGPIMPFVSGVDLTGDGTTSQPLPGLSFNCLNSGCGSSDLQRAVASWNQTYAGTKDALGKTIPSVVLPTNYQLGDNFNSQDIRVTKTFKYKERYKLAVFGECFNVFNIANLGGYSFNLDQVTPTNQTFSFGQPTSRAGQVFGSGGPRAFQLGGRIQF
ncbi:MAG TPA: carboxypeptidase regulatory-like domain-containing protein [Bryobacteraceae bacterium]|nr:carboxypeptidase regulatory-like domain-containing protein [Bryobacteraceae bacterium]